MDWVEGETLDKRVESMVEKKDVRGLEKLSGLWQNAILGLREASIAHGDMQHANILTRNGSLCLVDYDGVFIPSFQGKNALEAGHRNYQHPGRASSKDFGLHIDHFSAFVIYFSILAVAADPKIWKTFHQDESLILNEADYRTPNKSEILKKLKRSGESHVRELAAKLEHVCTQPVDAVPSFEALVPIPSTAPSKTLTNQTDGSDGAWWNNLSGLHPTSPPVIPATGTNEGSVAPTSPTRNPISPPAQKKEGVKKVLLFLLVLLILAACAVLFVAIASAFLYY
jgi:hypothetical protein